MTEIRLVDAVKCTGCMACAEICTAGAIRVESDEAGFRVPCIDVEKCRRCGRCSEFCPALNPVEQRSPAEAHVAAANVRTRGSSSAGMFGALAEEFLKRQDSLVCGCVLNEHMEAVHVLSDAPDVVASMRGSKYVQSDLTSALPQIRSALKMGRRVLFCGMPCQCAAVRKLCGEDENLYLVDLICHGVPSPGFWRHYLDETASDAEWVRFRPEDRWEPSNGHILVKTVGRKPQLRFSEVDIYMRLYYGGLNLRESCYSCEYASSKRVGDLTLGDCADFDWNRTWANDRPLSDVLVNTSRGRVLLDTVATRFSLRDMNTEAEFRMNRALCGPVKRPEMRSELGSKLLDMPAREIRRHYCRMRPQVLVSLALRRILSPAVRRKIKRLVKRDL